MLFRLLATGFLLLAAQTVSASTIVFMQLVSPPGEPNIYTFLVDGTPYQLLCDDAQTAIGEAPYQATENTLSDLTGTLLQRDGDPNAYQDYQTIAILDLYALANSDPSDIETAEEAIWAITQDRAPREPDAQTLLTWAESQNTSSYNFTNFVIFSTPDYQEQTGWVPPVEAESTPEPPAWLMAIAGLSLLAWRGSSFSYRRS